MNRYILDSWHACILYKNATDTSWVCRLIYSHQRKAYIPLVIKKNMNAVRISSFTIKELSNRCYVNGYHPCHIQISMLKETTTGDLKKIPLTEDEIELIRLVTFSASLDSSILLSAIPSTIINNIYPTLKTIQSRQKNVTKSDMHHQIMEPYTWPLPYNLRSLSRSKDN